MGRENTVFMCMYLDEMPIIKTNKEGDCLSGKFRGLTVRRSYTDDKSLLKGSPRWDRPIIYSRNPYIIKKHMLYVDEGDLIFIKGTLCTKETKKKCICPECGCVSVREGVSVYVDPLVVNIIKKQIGINEATDLLKTEYDEYSNLVMMMGSLVREPEYYESGSKKQVDMQIASNRIRRIREDPGEKTTDYPWVKGYGDRAKEYSEVLTTGSDIYINGAIQTRDVETNDVCPECGATYIRKSVASEIVPYHIEYGANCNKPEPTTRDDDMNWEELF